MLSFMGTIYGGFTRLWSFVFVPEFHAQVYFDYQGSVWIGLILLKLKTENTVAK